MAVKQFDPVDMLFLGLTFIGAGAMTGIISLNAFDVSLADQAFDIGQGVSLATLATALAVAGTILTNDNTSFSTLHDDVQKLDQYYVAAVAISLGGLVGWVFVGDVSSFFTSSDLWGVVYIGASVTAQMALGWLL